MSWDAAAANRPRCSGWRAIASTPPPAGFLRIASASTSRRQLRRRLRPYRRQMQMIFQDPYGSLHPRRRVGSIIGDPFSIHGIASGRERKLHVQELMELVGLNPEHYNRFPAEFSGGQRQRIGVARALALRPKLIVCDEPVSALDVSIQAQIINLLHDLQHDFGLTYIFIAHDLSVVRQVSDRIAVMYLGKIVEIAETEELFARPRHPYTNALLSAIPVIEENGGAGRQRIVLRGDVPSPIDPPAGCRFHPRCPKAQRRCGEEEPPLEVKLGDQADHSVACHYPVQVGEALGRDVLVRVAYGAQISLLAGVAASCVAVLIGVVIGLMAGYFGGAIDTFLARFMDVVLSFPFLLFAIALVSIVGPSLRVEIGIIAFFSWAAVGRIVRGQTLTIKEKEYIEAARSLGASDVRIMFVDIFPNLLAPVLVYLTLLIPAAIVFEATLSFLGLGVVPPTPSWGNMLAESLSYYRVAWWFVLLPGLGLLITTLAFNLLGDSVRDAFDPRGERLFK